VENIFVFKKHWNTRGVVNFYSAGVGTHDRRTGPWSSVMTTLRFMVQLMQAQLTTRRGITSDTLSAWSSGIVSARHRGDWSWSRDRIPPGYVVVAFTMRKKASLQIKQKNKISIFTISAFLFRFFLSVKEWFCNQVKNQILLMELHSKHSESDSIG
jgi:hypothetical protein